MLKDNIDKNFKKISEEKDNNMNDNLGLNLRGELEIWAYKNGELIHHDKGDNIVTKWAKHATMHLLTSEAYSTHGDRPATGGTISYTKRQTGSAHEVDVTNNDGTMLSNDAYLGDNNDYYSEIDSRYKYWTCPNPDIVTNDGDEVGANPFKYPFFPTKMLFGTGIEYKDWDAVIADGRSGDGQDGYGNPSNGTWTQETFNSEIDNDDNYYSASWDGSSKLLFKTRTVNDVYSAALSNDDNPMLDTNFAVKGAIKNGVYNSISDGAKLVNIEEKKFSTGEWRGIGRPSFIYVKRNARWMESGEAILEMGETTNTEDLESKITYTITMPEQSSAGEFYPYNGYTLKVAGLFADAAMLLKNTVPADNTDNDDSETNLEYENYMKQTGGILWATRNIAPIYKSHDTKIIAQWTIYL